MVELCHREIATAETAFIYVLKRKYTTDTL